MTPMLLLLLAALYVRPVLPQSLHNEPAPPRLKFSSSPPPLRLQMQDLCSNFRIICDFVSQNCNPKAKTQPWMKNPPSSDEKPKCIESFNLFYQHNKTLTSCIQKLPAESKGKTQALLFLEFYSAWQQQNACKLFHATEAKAATECSGVNVHRPWMQTTWPLYCHEVFTMYNSTRHELDELCDRTPNSEAFWEGYVDYIGSKTCKHYYDMVRDARERGCGEKDKALRGTECREMFQWYVDNKENKWSHFNNRISRDRFRRRRMRIRAVCAILLFPAPSTVDAEFVYYDFNGTTGLVLNGKAATSSCAPFKPTDYSKYAGAADVREATLEVTLTEQLEAIRLETRDTENHTTSGRIAVETAMLGHRDVFQASEEKRRCPVRLRLTASQPHQVSSVWYAQQLPVLQGFETRFTFQITDQSRRCFEVKDQNFGLHEYQSCAVHGGDGFAFVLHSHQNRTATLAAEGSNMGFAGLQNSLAIEFDTWFNDKNAGEDVFYDHVAIYSRGQKSNTDAENARMSAAVVHDLADGKVHVVKIRYYPELKYNYMPYFSATTNLTKFIKDVSEGRRVGTLLVFMDDGIKNDKPILAIPINLAATLRLDSDEAFVGFTASTSSSWQKHDVLGWYYCTEPPCLDQYDTEMTFDFDYNEQSMYSTASHSNTLYPIFIYPDTVSWAKRQAYFAANQKVGLVS
ncbi:hypothetical protein PC128_g9896 [Phytophthora cactorum]|nr:hypothetical protein PC128_g9896 [Phytophthora cactorum]